MAETETVYESLIAENKRLRQWVDDLQSGQQILCQFCGARLWPADRPLISPRVAILDHARRCPGNPLADFVRCVRAANHGIESLIACRQGISQSLLMDLSAAMDKALASIDSPDSQPATRNSQLKNAFTFLEVLFAVILLGIGFVMLAAMFSAGIVGTGAVMTDSRTMQVLRNAHQSIDAAAERPSFGSGTVLPAAVNSKGMPIIVPLSAAFLSQIGGQFEISDLRYGWAAFYRRDSASNPFAQTFVIALHNDDFPLYAKPIPIPPALYGSAVPALPSIEGALNYDANTQTSSIGFPASVSNAAAGAFALIADDETLPQKVTIKDKFGVPHTYFVLNNAPMTGRILRLGNPISAPAGTIAFALEPGKDLQPNDLPALAADGNPTGKVLVWMIGAAPLANSAAADFSGPFQGPCQDVGADSSFCAIAR